MSDLKTRIRDHYDSMAAPVTANEVRARVRPVRPDRRWRSATVFAASAATVLLLALPIILLRDPQPAPEIEDPAAPVIEGIWTRTLLESQFVAEDLRNTSFGLVAAAGQDGVWLSADGERWQQVLDVPGGEVDVETVVEFGGVVYAVGKYWSQEEGYEPRATVWRSENGRTWKKATIEAVPQLIEAAANDDRILIVGRYVLEEDGRAHPEVGTAIFVSNDGREWVEAETTGLQGVIWALSTFDNHFVAISAIGDTGHIFWSDDGVDWTEMGPWIPTLDPSYSVWPLVDLLEIPDGLVAVSVEGAQVEGATPTDGLRPEIVITTSSDGVVFEVMEEAFVLEDGRACSLQLEDMRSECPGWPPVQPPEGAAVGDRIIFLGHSYPSDTDQPLAYQWVGSLSD